MDGWLVAIVALLIGAAAAFLGISSRRTVSTIATLAPDPAGDPVAAVRSLSERADRLEAESAGRERDRETFVDSLTQGILEVDGGLRIVAANRAAGTLLGRDPRTLVGRTVIEVFLDTQVEATALAALGSGSATGEFGPAGADGPRLVVRARRAPSGSLWLVLEDVSELRRLQQIRTEFIDNLSHELRTPLTTVSLLAETLTREAEAAGDAVPPRMRDRIDKIEVETGHLVQMVNELLDLSRIESGGALGAMEILDLGQVATEIDRAAAPVRRSAGARAPGRCRRAAAPGAWRRGPARPGHRQSAPQRREVQPRRRRRSSPCVDRGGEVVVSVADHGVGIPAVAQPRIFERFYKVDRARVRGEAGGTGLGLAIARHVIEQHRGRIWVESNEGMGSHVLVRTAVHRARRRAEDRSRP